MKTQFSEAMKASIESAIQRNRSGDPIKKDDITNLKITLGLAKYDTPNEDVLKSIGCDYSPNIYGRRQDHLKRAAQSLLYKK